MPVSPRPRENNESASRRLSSDRFTPHADSPHFHELEPQVLDPLENAVELRLVCNLATQNRLDWLHLGGEVVKRRQECVPKTPSDSELVLP